MPKSKGNIQTGWEGRFYEDFEVGAIYRSRFGHTVTEADNALFTQLTHNTNPLHFDQHYAQQTKWGQILVNSTFTLALITGLSVPDVSENAMANLGWEGIKLPNPVFIGDTLYCETEVLSTRESNSYPEAGIVRVCSRGINQDGAVVIDLVRAIMVYKRENAPPKKLFPDRQNLTKSNKI